MIVTVVGNKFQFGDTVTSSLANTSAPELSLRRGHTYRFDQSHISNSGRALSFSLTNDGSHNSGSAVTKNVTISDGYLLMEDGDTVTYEDGDRCLVDGIAGTDGAYVDVKVDIDTNLWGDAPYEYNTG